MKKLTAILLAVVLMMLCCAPAMASISRRGTSVGDTVYVEVKKGSTVNIRNTPSAKGQCDYRLPNHSPAKIIGAGEGNYIQVSFKYQGKTMQGYIDMDYLTVTKPKKVNKDGAQRLADEHHTLVKELTFNSYQIPEEPTYIVVTPSRKGGYVNFRWVPSKESAVIAHVYDTTEEFSVITEGKNYYQVMSEEGYVGYIEKNFATKVVHVAAPVAEQ